MTATVLDVKPAMREGFSTGSAATAAAMAALCLAFGANSFELLQDPLPVPKPPKDYMKYHFNFIPSLQSLDTLPERILVPIKGVALCHDADLSILSSLWHAMAFVKKDGGDDPDATNNAIITAHIRLNNEHDGISIYGGEGVGKVTLPGLPLPVGESAINPAPRMQIRLGLKEIAHRYNYTGGIDVCISVENGKEIAKKTFNSRLGIVDGISILGTEGTVKPYSHSAWKATILQGLNVCLANGSNKVFLSTGRRSERFLQNIYQNEAHISFIQVADFAKFSLKNSGKMQFEEIIWSCFFGKLVKLAQGHPYTHAHHSNINFDELYEFCCSFKLDEPRIKNCVTASHALELILDYGNEHIIHQTLHSLCLEAAHVASSFAGQAITLHLFHLDGRELICIPKKLL